jgi:hypothetical protein
LFQRGDLHARGFSSSKIVLRRCHGSDEWLVTLDCGGETIVLTASTSEALPQGGAGAGFAAVAAHQQRRMARHPWLGALNEMRALSSPLSPTVIAELIRVEIEAMIDATPPAAPARSKSRR